MKHIFLSLGILLSLTLSPFTIGAKDQPQEPTDTEMFFVEFTAHLETLSRGKLCFEEATELEEIQDNYASLEKALNSQELTACLKKGENEVCQEGITALINARKNIKTQYPFLFQLGMIEGTMLYAALAKMAEEDLKHPSLTTSLEERNKVHNLVVKDALEKHLEENFKTGSDQADFMKNLLDSLLKAETEKH
jgi:hypothetical protein